MLPLEIRRDPRTCLGAKLSPKEGARSPRGRSGLGSVVVTQRLPANTVWPLDFARGHGNDYNTLFVLKPVNMSTIAGLAAVTPGPPSLPDAPWAAGPPAGAAGSAGPSRAPPLWRQRAAAVTWPRRLHGPPAVMWPAAAHPPAVTWPPSAARPRRHVAGAGALFPSARGSSRATVEDVGRPPGRKPRGAADRACDSVSPARSAGPMAAAAAMAEQESARNGARNRGGVQRVEGKLRASVEKGDYYEAHQMYRTLFFRYRRARPPPAGPSARPPGPPPRPGRFPLAAPRRPASPLARAAACRLGGRSGRPWGGRAEGSGPGPDPGRTSASRSPASPCPARRHPAVPAASCPPPRPASPPPARPAAEPPGGRTPAGRAGPRGPPRAVRLKPARDVSRFSSHRAGSREGLSLFLSLSCRPRPPAPSQRSCFPSRPCGCRAALWRVGRAAGVSAASDTAGTHGRRPRVE